MVNYIEAIKKPFTNFKRLILGVIFFLPIPLIKYFTNIFALGYTYQYGLFSYQKNTEIPKWERVGKLWVNGFVASLIEFIYAIPILVIYFLIVGPRITNALQLGAISSYLSLFGYFKELGFITIGAMILILFIIFIGPIAKLRWIIFNKFKAGFEFKKIFRIIFSKNYFFAWLALTVIRMIFGLLLLFILFGSLSFNFMEEMEIDSAELVSFILHGTDLESALIINIIKWIIMIIFTALISFVMNCISFSIYGSIMRESNIS